MSSATSSAKARLETIVREHQLDDAFPPEVEAEARAHVARPGLDDPALTDLSELAFVTIDHATSKDLDQAVYVARTDRGFRVDYAIADPAHYVCPGSALFAEALRRGASYYLPGWMIPMLPRSLSEGLVSLNEGLLRRALVFRMEVDDRGILLATSIVRARIRSRKKLSFHRSQAFLEGDEATLGDPAVDESLRMLREVGQRRMELADERDVVRYRRSEVTVRLSDVDPMRFVVSAEVRVPIERYNEQVSLLCNREGARWLRRAEGVAGVHPIYRVHEPPEATRVAALEALLERLARRYRLDRQQWTWQRDRDPLATFLDRLPTEGRDGRIARAIHRQAIMINGRSSFRTEPGVHHGVGADVYGRFSAPMREIVGVFLHKELHEHLRNDRRACVAVTSVAQGSGGPSAVGPGSVQIDPTDADRRLREEVVTAANRAKDLQRRLTDEANRLVLDQLFAEDLRLSAGDRPGRVGTVMGMLRGKVYVLLDDPPIDVKVYVPHLEEAWQRTLRPTEEGAALVDSEGRAWLRLGEEVRVRVVERDDRRDRWKFLLQPTSAPDRDLDAMGDAARSAESGENTYKIASTRGPKFVPGFDCGGGAWT
jgi:ribonuclease R